MSPGKQISVPPLPAYSARTPSWYGHQIVADIRGWRDKHDNSSVRLYHLLTWRHTPHPHFPPSVGGNIFPQSLHLSHSSYCTIMYLHVKQSIQCSSISPDSILRIRTPAQVAESGVSVLTSLNHNYLQHIRFSFSFQLEYILYIYISKSSNLIIGVTIYDRTGDSHP